jgi:hypothetical protein
MTLRKKLHDLLKVILEEADRNEQFREKLEAVLVAGSPAATGILGKGKSARRKKAPLDPVEVARKGEEGLRATLSTLDLEQLRDVVAQYGMDPSKLVMKWKDKARVIDRIVEVSLDRAMKGSAFRDD